MSVKLVSPGSPVASAMPDKQPLSDRHLHVAELANDYLRRVAAGEEISTDEFCREHAEYHDDLRDELNRITSTVHCNLSQATPPIGKLFPGQTKTHDPVDSIQATIDHSRSSKSISLSDVAHEVEHSQEPKSFGEYELIEVIGRGGMGIVCKARQKSIDRIVALKMIRDGQLAGDGDIERFDTEARAAGSLTHPNIVTVHESGVFEGHHFYSMEFIEGEDLGQRIKNVPLTDNEITSIMITISKAIHYAHTKGILHRDLKPANVLIDEHGHPLVTDFGLARRVDKHSGLTPSGAPMGTPAYMPPEQAAGKVEEFGPPGDVYSLGAVLYEMLCGQKPFEADSLADIIMKVLHKAPVPPRAVKSTVNRDLETICLKCLQKEPAKRYASALELAEDLERERDGKPILARPTSLPRKAWYWLRDIPLVGALVGRRVVHPTAAHKAAQWSLLTAATLIVAGFLAWQFHTPGLPAEVRVVSGQPEGKYFAVASDLATSLAARLDRPSMAVETAGSVENHRRLLDGTAELGLIQAEALESNQLAVATPLYYEFMLIIVRRSAIESGEIKSIDDLAEAHVALGPPGSGMRQSALHILRLFDIDGTQLPSNESNFLNLLTDDSLDAAIVISGLGNPGVRRVLESDAFDLLPIPTAERVAMRIPSFHAGHAFPEQLPEQVASRIDSGGLATLFTPAYLVVRRDAPDILVRETLATLFNDQQLLEKHGLLTRTDAAGWHAIPRHRAAEAFFEEGLANAPSR